MPIWKHSTNTEARRWAAFIAGLIGNIAYMPVSYTHLTLPTKA